ncbi:hypothetical protein K501DRAFT_319953 [Backusella circina FSU 941]|nr:hypothetical protein K501DRAFT_319953 [Backusella circina FSU 941]
MMDYTSCETPLTAIKTDSSKEEPTCDKAVNMLLAKLDEGTQTVVNLRSILTLKTAELNELLAQLELTHQAITSVEMTTSQIETMLKDLGLNNHPQKLIIDAEASLDSAIKSATTIYTQQLKPRRPPSSTSSHEQLDKRTSYNARSFTSKIRYKPDTKHILRKLNDLVRDLELDSGKFFASLGTTDDYEVLQKAFVNLDIAKTIALSAKSNMKRRAILLRSSRRRNNREEIQALGDKIREGVSLWMTYTNNTPLLFNNEDIITVLDREDALIAKNQPVHSTSRTSYDGRQTITPTNRTSITPRTSNTPIITPSHSGGGGNTSTERRHSRAPSTVDSFIPLPPSSQPPPVEVAAATKKRQSVGGTRLTQVRASVGLPRVRTTSLTTTNHPAKPSPPRTPPTNAKITAAALKQTAADSANAKPPVRLESAIPSAPDSKKSQLKPPTQRGPGSTLRLRSMLAKKKQTAGK